MPPVTATLTHLVASFGLPALVVLMALDSCGAPLPSEVIMPVAGPLAAAGHLNVAAVVFGGAFGSLLGAVAAYSLAARFGTALILGPGRWLGFRERHLDLANRWFVRHGWWTVLVGRVVSVAWFVRGGTGPHLSRQAGSEFCSPAPPGRTLPSGGVPIGLVSGGWISQSSGDTLVIWPISCIRGLRSPRGA